MALQQSADAAFEGLKSRAVKHIRHGSRTILQAGGAALAELAMATATTSQLEGDVPPVSEGEEEAALAGEADELRSGPTSGLRRR
jgi:hypothetical protein